LFHLAKRPATSSTNFLNKKKSTNFQSSNQIKINNLLARFVFGCNINLAVVENPLFREFIAGLDPSYKIPCIKTLSTTLLDLVFNELHPQIPKETVKGTLLMDGWKNSNSNRKYVVAMVKPRGGKEVLIESYDFTDLKGDHINLLTTIQAACEKAKTDFNIEVDSICTDNEPAMRKAAKESNHKSYGCLSHLADLMINTTHDEGLEKDVKKVLVCYRKPSLQDRLLEMGGKSIILRGETRWKGEKDELMCLHKNFDLMVSIADKATLLEVPDDIRQIHVKILGKSNKNIFGKSIFFVNFMENI
jgi:hypothetical protein